MWKYAPRSLRAGAQTGKSRASRTMYCTARPAVVGPKPKSAHLQDPLDERRAVIHVPRGRGSLPSRTPCARAPDVMRRRPTRPWAGGFRRELRVRVAQLAQSRPEERTGKRARLLEVLPCSFSLISRCRARNRSRRAASPRPRAQVLLVGRLHRRFGVPDTRGRVCAPRPCARALLPHSSRRAGRKSPRRGARPSRTPPETNVRVFASRARRVYGRTTSL